VKHDSLMRFLLLAAGANIPASDFRAFLDSLRASDPEELTKVYNEIRRRIRQIQMLNFDDQFEFARNTRSSQGAIMRDIISMAANSGLEPRKAMERIYNKLIVLPNIDRGALPAYSPRENFGIWLTKTARVVGPNALINAAVSALSPEADESTEDWRLSRP
jgi:hypothetical protein